MKKYYSATIWDPDNAEFEPWVSVFSEREKAENFKEEAEKIIAKMDMTFVVSIDSGTMDGQEYLNWLTSECNMRATLG